MKSHYGLYINGQETEAQAGATFTVENPATGKALTTVADATGEDVERAVAAARESFADGRWSALRGRDRAQILRKAADALAARIGDIAQFETLQVGRPLREMQAQLGRVPEWLEYFGSLAHTFEGSLPDFGTGHLNYVRRVPVGVVGLITPWNHPLLITMKKLSAAVAAGNSVVIKPSEFAPVATLELAAICEESGMPPGVINVVPGYGAVAGKALTQHPELGRVDLTGGTETGKIVASAAGANLVPVTAELGGKAPVVVFEDTDPGVAASAATFAAFVATGQTCVQGARLLVHEAIYDDVAEAFVERAANLRTGDPLASTTQVGPLASSAQLERVTAAVERARAEGATVLCGGEPLDDPALEGGYYYPPTVLGEVGQEESAWQEEIFGPVTVLRSFQDEAEAITLANDTPFGLAASVWTRDIARAHRVASAIEAGIVWVNDHHRIDPASPWGGLKSSGMGQENGIDAYRWYTQQKSVIVNTNDEPFDWFATDEVVRYS